MKPYIKDYCEGQTNNLKAHLFKNYLVLKLSFQQIIHKKIAQIIFLKYSSLLVHIHFDLSQNNLKVFSHTDVKYILDKTLILLPFTS